jgi:hypothetical protein
MADAARGASTHVNRKVRKMHKLLKIALVPALLSGIAEGLPQAANAGVTLSVGLANRPHAGFWYGPPGPCAVHRYSYGTPWRDCGYHDWHHPIFIEGSWYHGPFYYRYRHGQRWYWWRGGWRRDEWRGAPGGWRGSARWGDHDTSNSGR